MTASPLNLGEVPFPQRFKCWREAICETYLTVDCETLSHDVLTGLICARRFGSLEISQVTSPPMAYRRGGEALRDSRGDCFQLVLSLEGHGVVEQGNKRTQFGSGDMVIYSSSEESTVTYPQGSTTQVVKIPGALLLDRLGTANGIGATLLEGSTALGSMARSLIRECMKLSLSNQADDVRLCHGTLDILAAAVESRLSAAADRNRSGPLATIQRYIEANLADPELDIQRIAFDNGISVRTLNRVFAAEGLTVNAWMWNRRLAASYRLLSEGSVKRVSQAAFDSGFNDLSHFGRAFKKRYGLLPFTLLHNGH